ncbi:MAG TPA: sigma-70 family RNA polymerase sigma factor [Gemmataceae bacterium]|jgi:RNA polymerase sigma-70 factor (ECF subfamily)|nr:sigma-70 family RNA polymerase sigma factor [Gemmataceae bacterium]
MTNWIGRVREQESGFEREVVDRYTQGLLELARRRLPRQIKPRLDPEDVLQSVYRSFFRRLADGEFQFDGPDDLWRLLATITFRKVSNARKFHLRARRDARREHPWPEQATDVEPTELVVQEDDVDVLWEALDELVHGLPDRCRDILVLRLEGHPIAAIADKVGRSQRTVLRVLAGVVASANRSAESPS